MITAGAIQSFCDELAEIYHPERIVLFGSYVAAFPALREAYGLKSIDVFGSVARDEALPGSDIDLLVGFEPGRTCGYFGFFHLQKELERILGVREDLVTADALK